MDQGVICFLLACALFPMFILVALVVKLREVRRAKRWPSAPGKVVACGIESNRKKPGDLGYNFSDTEVENQPRVEYEYHVDGKKYRGTRIMVGEKFSGFEVEAVLARYVVGTDVIVYYDPAHPESALLERDLPMGILILGMAGLMLFFIGGPLLLVFLYSNGLAWMESHLANRGAAPFVTALTLFGLAVLFFAFALLRMMVQAMRWPTARGRITDSGIERFLPHVSHDYPFRPRFHYKSSVVYSYEVKGRTFRGDRLTIGLVLSATLPGFARRLAARYPVGTEVDVYYNPESPGECVLHPYSNSHLLLWLIGGAMLWFAWSVGMGGAG